jgi:hypothetical protein
MEKMYWEYAREVYKKVREYHMHRPKKVEMVIRTSWRDNGRLLIFDSLRERLDRECGADDNITPLSTGSGVY